ncbi:hypothetical protein CRG98_026118 [Punica granatum]|uniref:Uncharacterized protein n=1 Tax=Punica granatum TaxID=22663 RepID=A0A2I0JB13_PUNGR|nr:hypothetical protein CRG98_026118 [Punica granatum]
MGSPTEYRNWDLFVTRRERVGVPSPVTPILAGSEVASQVKWELGSSVGAPHPNPTLEIWVGSGGGVPTGDPNLRLTWSEGSEPADKLCRGKNKKKLLVALSKLNERGRRGRGSDEGRRRGAAPTRVEGRGLGWIEEEEGGINGAEI